MLSTRKQNACLYFSVHVIQCQCIWERVRVCVGVKVRATQHNFLLFKPFTSSHSLRLSQCGFGVGGERVCVRPPLPDIHEPSDNVTPPTPIPLPYTSRPLNQATHIYPDATTPTAIKVGMAFLNWRGGNVNTEILYSHSYCSVEWLKIIPLLHTRKISNRYSNFRAEWTKKIARFTTSHSVSREFSEVQGTNHLHRL